MKYLKLFEEVQFEYEEDWEEEEPTPQIKSKVLKILTNPRNKQSIIDAANNGFKIKKPDPKDLSMWWDEGEDPINDYIRVVFDDGTRRFHIHKNNLN